MRTFAWFQGGIVCRMAVILFLSASLFMAQLSAEPQSQQEQEWTAQVLMKFGGDLTLDREGLVAAWPDSVDMMVVVKAGPIAKEDKFPPEPVATGWLLPLPPSIKLGTTKTRVRLSPGKQAVSGWELKGMILVTPKDVNAGHYPVDVVFEVADAGPGYRVEFRNFRGGRSGFQMQATPVLFAPGAEHQIVGCVQLANMVITGDESYPLTFRFTQTGYEYCYGRGRVKVGSTREISFGEKDSVDYWTSHVGSSEGRIREAAAGALGFLPREDAEKQAALAALLKLAVDPVATVRRNAAESLGRLKYPGAQQLLKTMSTTDKDEWVRKVASWADRMVAQTNGMSATTP